MQTAPLFNQPSVNVQIDTSSMASMKLHEGRDTRDTVRDSYITYQRPAPPPMTPTAAPTTGDGVRGKSSWIRSKMDFCKKTLPKPSALVGNDPPSRAHDSPALTPGCKSQSCSSLCLCLSLAAHAHKRVLSLSAAAAAASDGTHLRVVSSAESPTVNSSIISFMLPTSLSKSSVS